MPQFYCQWSTIPSKKQLQEANCVRPVDIQIQETHDHLSAG